MRRKILLELLSFIILLSTVGCTDIHKIDTNSEQAPNGLMEEHSNQTSPASIPNYNDTETEENIEILYADDEGINLFINRYNEINENKLTTDMLYKAHIGGQDRDDCVRIKNDKLEIQISKNYGANGIYNMSVYVGYTQAEASLDDYKEQFINYIRVFDDSLSNEEINNHWNTLTSGYHSSYTINDIDVTVSSDVNKMTYFKFTKSIEL